MDRSISESCLSQKELEAFSVLVLRYLDGVSTADEVLEIKRPLVESSACREVFAQTCRLQGELREAFAHQRAARQATTGDSGSAAADDTIVHGSMEDAGNQATLPPSGE